ncbi:MAG TPA: hypothetical protein VD770_02040, partial [Coxiellaceae bacterium]|nr:hypothetical protein [Coxiellaceae bacterium]
GKVPVVVAVREAHKAKAAEPAVTKLKHREKLTANLEGFTEEARELAEEKILRRGQRVTAIFFNPDRIKSDRAAAFRKDKLKSRTEKSSKENIFNHSGDPARLVIATDAGARKDAIRLAKIRKKSLAEYESSTFYIQQKLFTSSFTHKPTINQPGNIFVNFGRESSKYGAIYATLCHLTGVDANVAVSVKTLPEKQKKNEQALATLILAHAKTGLPLEKEHLKNAGLQMKFVDKTLLNRLHRICLLVNYKEIDRFLEFGLGGAGKYAEGFEAPVALGYYFAMQLVVAGKLTLAEIFDSREYGMFTLAGIASNPHALNRQFYSIYKKYLNEMLSPEDLAAKKAFEEKNPRGKVVFFRSALHTLLKDFSGEMKASLTDGESDYESSDEETRRYSR